MTNPQAGALCETRCPAWGAALPEAQMNRQDSREWSGAE